MMKPVILLFITLLFAGCMDKFDINQFDDNKNVGNIGGDTVYVQLSPAWEGFNNPQAIMVGKEPFIYVADTDNDRVVMLNIAGNVLGSRSIKKPIALAQDYKLNLIVCAQLDTLVGGVSTSYSAVYKINLFEGLHNIETAEMVRILPRANSTDFNFPLRKYTAAAAFYNNWIYIARTGPNNESPFDPDNSILMFQPGTGGKDSLIGRVPNIDALSSGLLSANQISSMATFPRKNLDMIITLTSDVSFKAQWFHYMITLTDEKYVSQFNPVFDDVKFVQSNVFNRPTGSWVDASGNIYIADAGKDSIYKFNSFGEEMHSFGGPSVFIKAYGVAFFDRTLYVADAGANKVLRFVLSTDLR